MNSKIFRLATVLVLASTLPVSPSAAFGGISSPEAAVTLGQAFMGPAGTGTAFTRVSITNRDVVACDVQVSLSRGSNSAPPVLIDGEPATDNSTMVTLPRGGFRVLEFRSEFLVQGVIAVSALPPCSGDSRRVAGTYFVTRESGELMEVFSIPANSARDWLTKDRCTAVSYRFDPGGLNGIRSNLGLVTSSAVPLARPPEEMRLVVSLFDAAGLPLGEGQTFAVDGIHSPFFPLDQFPGLEPQALTLILCLETGEPEKGFQMDVTAIGVRGSPLDVQFEAAVFADGFESGDVSAWSR